jgi:hypothetical protein
MFFNDAILIAVINAIGRVVVTLLRRKPAGSRSTVNKLRRRRK